MLKVVYRTYYEHVKGNVPGYNLRGASLSPLMKGSRLVPLRLYP